MNQKNFSKEQLEKIQQKAEQHFCNGICKMNFNIKISAKEAIGIATKDAGGFLGTDVNSPILKEHYWHISAFSKSAKPPMYYIVDANDGKIVLKLDNSDDPKQKKKLKEFIDNH